MPHIYPSSDFDDSQKMLSILGSFWTRTYMGIDQLQSYAVAKGQLETQTYQDILEAIASVCRFTVPLFHRDNWHLLALRESEMNTATTNVRRFDEEPCVDFDSGDLFDAPALRPYFRFARPAQLVTAPLIFNRMTTPSLSLARDVDFVMPEDEQTIIFRDNPFENSLIPTRPVYADGIVVDRELALWVFRGDFDWEHVYNHFGYVVDLKLKSSAGYRDLVNAIFDAIVAGSPAAALDLAFSCIVGAPLVRNPEETVEKILHACDALTIITDKEVYKFSALADSTVYEGQTVYVGDTLTNQLRIDELNRGEAPDGLQFLSLGKGFLLNCFYGDLLFENKEVHLSVDANHSSGYTFCSFGVGGFPADVHHFFEEMHRRGIVAAEAYTGSDPCTRGRKQGTLAHLLDRRVNSPDEPEPQHLPATINPLEFLVANVLRNNAYLIRIKAGTLGRRKLGLYNLRHLRRLIPPHSAVIVVIEMPSQSEVFSAVEQISEAIRHYQGLGTMTDEVAATSLMERITIRLVSGTCQ